MKRKIIFFLSSLIFLVNCGGGGGGSSCGGVGGAPCPDGQFCKYEDLACGAVEVTGSCQEIPLACEAIVNPVCTCDGLTFDNECLAEAAGQSVVSFGECA